MLLILAIALVLAAGLLVIAILRPPSRPAAVVGLYLLGYANIVLVGEIANSFWQLNNPLFWLGLHFVLLVVAWLAWRWVGRPHSLLEPWLGRNGRLLYNSSADFSAWMA